MQSLERPRSTDSSAPAAAVTQACRAWGKDNLLGDRWQEVQK